MGFDLYRQLADTDKNAIFSPASLAIALSMIASGARGETQAEMLRLLHTGDLPDADVAFAGLLASMNALDGHEGLALHVESRMWGQRGAPFNLDFLSRVRADYGAGLEDVDFDRDAKGVCNAIDAWAARATHGLVGHVFDECPGPLMLANAVYFHGKWATPFEPRRTTDAEFRTLRGETIQVPTMREDLYTRYAYVDAVKVLELPYRGGLSMFVAVPDDPKGLANLERHLGTQYERWRVALASEPWDVTVSLPKWTANASYDLGARLAALGMRRVFTRLADLSGISQKQPLKLCDVMQGTFIAVEEEGTEAAAVTGASIVPLSRSLRSVEFRADRPFVYLIEDHATGAVLFAGRVVDPRR